MEERPDKGTKKANRKRRAGITALLSLIIFIAAVLLVRHFVFSNKESNDTNGNQGRVAVVRITDQGFEPSTLTVPVGTRVLWTNTGQTMRQIASNPYPRNDSLPNLKSEILNNKQTYSYSAQTAGTFGYHDQLQPTINGTLVIKER